jgi:hypothetical protein
MTLVPAPWRQLFCVGDTAPPGIVMQHGWAVPAFMLSRCRSLTTRRALLGSSSLHQTQRTARTGITAPFPAASVPSKVKRQRLVGASHQASLPLASCNCLGLCPPPNIHLATLCSNKLCTTCNCRAMAPEDALQSRPQHQRQRQDEGPWPAADALPQGAIVDDVLTCVVSSTCSLRTAFCQLAS